MRKEEEEEEGHEICLTMRIARKTLYKQKGALIKLESSDSEEVKKHRDELTGLINLLDYLGDEIAKDLGEY
jgi:hypothetical protein